MCGRKERELLSSGRTRTCANFFWFTSCSFGVTNYVIWYAISVRKER